jgi:hypothetical protein
MSDLGCALSSVIACLWCASGCSSQRVGANFAFFPPDPPTYSIRYTASPPSPLSLCRVLIVPPTGAVSHPPCSLDEQGQTKLRLHLRLGTKPDRPHVRTHVKRIDTANKQSIPVFSFRVPNPRCVLLFR